MTETHDSSLETPCLPGGLITIDQWSYPELSVRRSIKDTFRHISQQLRGGASRKEQPFQSLDDLPEFADNQRHQFAPDPDFADLATTLAEALRQGKEDNPSANKVSFLVAPPFSGVRQALVRWPWINAGGNGRQAAGWVIAPPDNLLMSEDEAREWWDKQDLSRRWVLPELADFWLRHMRGLALVRELLRRISAGKAGQGVIGCSSWCWQFWASYTTDLPVAPFTPAPLNADYLGKWLEHLCRQQGCSPVIARMANDGRYVLPTSDKLNGKKIKHSDFLSDLAATSRGNHGVALALWRSAIRAEPEEDNDKDDGKKGEPSPKQEGQSPCCWVVPLDKLSLPAMPKNKDRALGLVLHALLLHDGLDEEGLLLAAGLTRQEVAHALALLERADLIRFSDSGNCWHVTDLGYPTIRRHLQSWGFPVDGF